MVFVFPWIFMLLEFCVAVFHSWSSSHLLWSLLVDFMWEIASVSSARDSEAFSYVHMPAPCFLLLLVAEFLSLCAFSKSAKHQLVADSLLFSFPRVVLTSPILWSLSGLQIWAGFHPCSLAFCRKLTHPWSQAWGGGVCGSGTWGTDSAGGPVWENLQAECS